MPPSSAATIEISKDYLHFNAAHFTLFSATEREDLHGHTFYVAATVTSPVGDDGLAPDLLEQLLFTDQAVRMTQEIVEDAEGLWTERIRLAVAEHRTAADID